MRSLLKQPAGYVLLISILVLLVLATYIPATAQEGDDIEIYELGAKIYSENCAACHGDGAVAAGGIPDLRHMDSETHQSFDASVRGGVRHEKGMAGFAQVLSQQQAASIYAYIIERANAAAGEVSK